MKISSFNISNTLVIMLIQGILSFVFVSILLYPNLTAQWGIIDDHMIMAFMGSDQNLSLSEVPSMVLKSEVGMPGFADRYRPFYFLLYITETALFGNNPSIRYLSRIFYFGIAILITWRLLSRLFGGVILGGLACLVMLSHSFWGGIWACLGPSEIYGTVALAVYSLAFSNLWRESGAKRSALWWWVLAGAALVAMGVKENFLFLLLPSIALLYRIWRTDRLSWNVALANTVIIGFGLLVAGAVILAVNKQGHDLHSQSITPASRLQILKDGLFSLKHWQMQLPVCISAFLLALNTLYRWRRPNNAMLSTLSRILRNLFALELGLMLLWYSQYIFYNGAWPDETRYAFPGILCRDFAYLLFVSMLPQAVALLALPERRQLLLKRVYYAVLCAAFIFMTGFGLKELVKVNQAAQQNRDSTRAFVKSLTNLIEEVKAHPATPIILESHSVWDIEPISSVRRFLTVYGVSNPLYLKLEGWSAAALTTDLEKKLGNRMEKLSRLGDLDNWYGFIYAPQIPFYPISKIQLNGECFAVGFSGEPISSCRHLGKIYPVGK